MCDKRSLSTWNAHIMIDKLTHEKWLENPYDAFLHKGENAKKCIETSKCSDHGHGKAGAVFALLPCFIFTQFCFLQLLLPFSKYKFKMKNYPHVLQVNFVFLKRRN